MQAVVNQSSTENATSQQWTISIEVLAYIALAIFALLFRIAELDAVPLSDYEAQQALHAWHTVTPSASGEYVISSSPITYVLQVFSYSTLGASEFTARFGAVIAGMLLSLTPILFREQMGRTRAFIWAVLLSLLTVPVVASRYADGTTWMMLFTVLSIWVVWRYWYSKQVTDAMWATAFITMMVLLSSPSGIPLLVILLVSGWLAVWRTALSAPERLDLTGDDILQTSLKRLTEFPFLQVAFVPVIMVILVATTFMLNPSGLSTVSQLIESALRGISQPADSTGIRVGFLALLTYEPLLVIFAFGGSWLLWKHGEVKYVDRFAAAWAIVGTVGLLLYAGATAADSMWVVVPLTLLASHGITELMVNRFVMVLWTSDNDDDSLYSTRYWWVKWVISLGALLFIFILSVQFLHIARSALTFPPQATLMDVFSLVTQSQYNRLLQSLGLFILGGIASVIIGLIVASFWGNETTLQGIGLGFMLFLLMSGMGGAWNTAVENADSPSELWYSSATATDSKLLRDTLFEIAERDAQGFPTLEINVVTDSTVINNNSIVAWLLRDFPNARFVNSVNAVQGNQIILMAETNVNEPDFGGDYVGQSFVIRRTWSPASLNVFDFSAWWSQRRFRTEQQIQNVSILWLRQDVYNGIPITERPR